MPSISAACSHVYSPLIARVITSCIFMARSTAERENHMVTSSVTVCITPRESGHFTCYEKRTHHELPTWRLPALDAPRRPMLRSRPFPTETSWRRWMRKSGPLKAKVDRLEKKIAAKGASLDAGKRRVLHKKLKRFQ